MFHDDSHWEVEEGINGLHLAAHGDLHSVVTHLLADGTEIDETDCLGTTALMFAARGGHCATIEVLLHSGADASAMCQRGRTAAILACSFNHPGVVAQLVKSGRNVAINAFETVSNRSALITAVCNGNLTAVKELLVCPNLDDNMSSNDNHGEDTALYHVTCYGYAEIVQVLLGQPDLSVSALNAFNHAAVIAAASVGQSAILNLLLDRGADHDLKDKLGGPAILRAIDSGHLECVQILQARGADCTFVDTLGRNILDGCAVNNRHTILRYLLQTLQSLDPNAQDDRGQTPLHDAARHDHDRCVRVLLDFGARTDVLDNKGRSPVRAAKDSLRTRCLPLLELARNMETEKAGRDQRVKPTRVDTFGPNYIMLFHTAIHSLDQEALQRYLDTIGPETDMLVASRNTESSETPLHVAASRGKPHAVTWLLERGADIDAQDLWGGTPLLRAAQYGCEDVVKLLLDRGASLDLLDRLHRTALNFVTDGGLVSGIASLLIKRGAFFDQQTCALHDLLDWACERGDLELAKCLVKCGVAFQTKSVRDALTPYRRAQLAGQSEVADYLFAKTEEVRKPHPVKASHGGKARPERTEKSPVDFEDEVAGTHSTNMELVRALMADVSTRERYLLAVVVVLFALLVAR